MSRYELLHGDCLEKLKGLANNSVDAVVTDPPYELAFMGRKWDASGIAYSTDLWREVLRVLKPGGHLLAFGGSRTYHRMACAIEDAGFEVRDSIHWVYGSGFPKGLDVSKAVEAHSLSGNTSRKGIRRAIMGDEYVESAAFGKFRKGIESSMNSPRTTPPSFNPTFTVAHQWAGWNVALKPAHEPIVVARKPLIGTVAENVLEWGTGALNVDGCRVAHQTVAGGSLDKNPHLRSVIRGNNGKRVFGYSDQEYERAPTSSMGRWPPNLLFSHLPECGEAECADGCAVRELDEQSGVSTSRAAARGGSSPNPMSWGKDRAVGAVVKGHTDSGGASRFFPVFRYQAKAPTKERKVEGVQGQHPTQKPVELMRWLVRLVTPPNGLVLDPFTGSGTTGVAALLEGFRFIGCEREDEYFAIATARLEHALKEQPAKKEKQATLFDLEAP